MDVLYTSNIDVIPTSIIKYPNLIEKIKKNKIFIDYLKLNNSILDIENLCDDVIYDMFKKYMVFNKENISSQTDTLQSNSLQSSKNIPVKLNLTNTLITKNYNQAEKYIKDMLTPQKLIIVNGRINKIPLRILVNTGSTYNFIYKNKILEASLNNLIDSNLNNNINSNANINGTVWYYEIDIELKKNIEYIEYATFPIKLIVLEDNKTSTKKTTNSYNTDFDMILGINFMNYYGIIINFNTNTLQMDNNIIIEFD